MVTFWPISTNGSLYNDYTLVQVGGMPNRDITTCIKNDYMETRIQQIICGVDSPILAMHYIGNSIANDKCRHYEKQLLVTCGK